MKIVVRFALFLSLLSGTAAHGQSIWVSRDRINQLAASGPAWTALRNRANATCATPNLSNQDDAANVCVMAKALVFAKLGDIAMRDSVVAALRSIANSGTYSGRALALGRELGAYVISADLIGLRTLDPVLHQSFSAKIRQLRNTPTSSGPSSLVACHEQRPNNWGTHCGASRIAVDAYLGDTADLERAAAVFHGWLGDRTSYSGFSYGDSSWQANPSAPVGINPAGSTKQGHSIDGVLPDDQRRGGGFTWPPPKENYVYEALQGALAEAVLLTNAGYDAFGWNDSALLRAFQWLHTQANFAATGDDTWEPHIVNHYYATVFPAPIPSTPGKNVGFADWTHSGTSGGPPPPPNDVTLPQVTMTAPAAGAVSGVVTLRATATDNVGVTGVQFEVNGQPLGAEQSVAPFSQAWDTTTVPNGSYALTATARDAAANERTSTAITVLVNNVTTPPPSGITFNCTGTAQSQGLSVTLATVICVP